MWLCVVIICLTLMCADQPWTHFGTFAHLDTFYWEVEYTILKQANVTNRIYVLVLKSLHLTQMWCTTIISMFSTVKFSVIPFCCVELWKVLEKFEWSWRNVHILVALCWHRWACSIQMIRTKQVRAKSSWKLCTCLSPDPKLLQTLPSGKRVFAMN